jgi:hypothetical protein
MNWRAWAFALFVLALGLGDTVGLLTGAMQPTRPFNMFWAVILLAGGILLTAVVATTKLVVSDDVIEERSIFEKNRLRSSEIRGRRETIKRGLTGFSSSWKLEPKDNRARAIDINNFYTLDDVFYEWLNQIPDLDAEDVPDPCA